MRKLLFLGLSVIYALATTLCSYTPLETQYITNEDNYIELDVVVSSAEYHEDGYSYLYINLTEFSRYRGLTGKNPVNYEQETLQNTIIEIKIVSKNAELLKERGFFDNVKAGDKIGELIAQQNGREIARAPIIAKNKVSKIQFFGRIMKNIKVMLGL